MDCADVRSALQRGEVPRGADVDAHLSGCPACAALVGAPALAHALAAATTDAGASSADALAASLSRTLAQVEAEQGGMARMREMSSGRRVALAIAVATLVPVAVSIAMPRPDLGVLPMGRLVLDVLLYAVPAVAALLVALAPMQRAVPVSTRVLVVLAGVLAAAGVAALPQMHTDHPASVLGADAFARRALACLGIGTLAALPAFAALRMLAREGTSVGAKAFALAIAAALVGSAAVFLHCPITDPAHLWAGHVTVLVPAAIWAAWHRMR